MSYGWIGRDIWTPSDGHLQHYNSLSTPDRDDRNNLNNSLDYCNSATEHRHQRELEHGDNVQPITDESQCRQSDLDNDVFIEYNTRL